MKINDGASFNAEWVRKQTEKEFLQHEKDSGLSEDELKHAFRLIKGIDAPAQAEKKDNDKKGAV